MNEDISWEESVELRLEQRLKRIQALEKAVVALRGELIDEIRRRKALEDYILEREKERAEGITLDRKSTKREKRKSEKGSGSKRKLSTPLKLSDVENTWFEKSSVLNLNPKAKSLSEYDHNKMLDWLDQNKLSGLRPLWTNEELSEEDKNTLSYARMFARIDDTNKITLEKCNIGGLLEFIFLPEDIPLRELWDTNTFIRDLILTNQGFMRTSQLFKFLSLKCSGTGATTTTILMTKDFIKQMVTFLKYDILVDKKLQVHITELSDGIAKVNADVAKEIQLYLDTAIKPKRDILEPPEPSVLGLRTFVERGYDILALEQDTIEVARQMCLIEQKYFHGTETREFLNKAWTSERIPTPNLDR